MELYEEAERLDRSDRNEPVLRWNTCARFVMDHRLEAQASGDEPFVAYGD